MYVLPKYYLLYIVVVYQPNIKIAQNKQAAKLETTYLQIRKRKSRYLLREITFCPFIYSHYIPNIKEIIIKLFNKPEAFRKPKIANTSFPPF